MKKILFALVFGSLLLIHPSVSKAAQSTENFVEELQYSWFNGYTYDDHRLIQLNTSRPLEVVSIFKRENEYGYDYMIYVHELKNGEWKVSYRRPVEYMTNLSFITKGRMGATDKVLIGSYEGSGNFLDAYLIGSPNGRDIKLMQHKSSVFQGGAWIIDGVLFYGSGSIVSQKYRVQNGKVVSAGRASGRDDRLISKNPKIWLGLKMSGNRAVYAGKKTVYAKVGDRIGIGRYGVSDTRGYSYRLMSYDGSSVLSYDTVRPGMTAVKKGTAVLSLEPDAYGDAVEIKVIVR